MPYAGCVDVAPPDPMTDGSPGAAPETEGQ